MFGNNKLNEKQRAPVIWQRGFESSIAVSEYIMFEAFLRGDIMRRIGVNRFWPTFPVGICETKQGWLGVTTVTPAQWRAFCEMLGLFDLRDDATLFLGVDRLQHMEEIESRFVPKLKQRTAQEWFAEGLKRKIPIVPVPGIGDLIRDEEKKSRGAIVPIAIGDETGYFQALSNHLKMNSLSSWPGFVPAIHGFLT